MLHFLVMLGRLVVSNGGSSMGHLGQMPPPHPISSFCGEELSFIKKNHWVKPLNTNLVITR